MPFSFFLLFAVFCPNVYFLLLHFSGDFPARLVGPLSPPGHVAAALAVAVGLLRGGGDDGDVMQKKIGATRSSSKPEIKMKKKKMRTNFVKTKNEEVAFTTSASERKKLRTKMFCDLTCVSVCERECLRLCVCVNVCV